jgi:hypothetical protein
MAPLGTPKPSRVNCAELELLAGHLSSHTAILYENMHMFYRFREKNAFCKSPWARTLALHCCLLLNTTPDVVFIVLVPESCFWDIDLSLSGCGCRAGCRNNSIAVKFIAGFVYILEKVRSGQWTPMLKRTVIC